MRNSRLKEVKRLVYDLKATKFEVEIELNPDPGG
jgi:hypothetical protein